ncbi:acetyltransferase [Flavobacterium suzhouense]|uniref:Acetyltransferase n=1 Tax=Flavobacterium suzhouense TaxID=1529638 RepID=A0ABW5NTR1_9FLAO
MSNYTISGYIHLCISLVRTKLTFRKARIIRFPIDLRGKNYMDVSEGFTTGFGCRLEAYPLKKEKVLFIGKNVQMNDYVHITAMEKVIIGDNVLMASKIYISDCSHGSYSGDEHDSTPDSIPAERKMYSKPVVIKDKVWLGEFVSVLPGVTIGKGTIVGANSVVSKSLPDYVIAVGSPAKPIKRFNFDTNKWEKII